MTEAKEPLEGWYEIGEEEHLSLSKLPVSTMQRFGKQPERWVGLKHNAYYLTLMYKAHGETEIDILAEFTSDDAAFAIRDLLDTLPTFELQRLAKRYRFGAFEDA